MGNGLATIVEDHGKGRPFIVVAEAGSYPEFTKDLFTQLSARTRVVVVEVMTLTDDNWQAATEELLALLAAQSIRQASFVSFGPAGALVQNLTITDPKLVRTIVFVDASTRAHPTAWQRIVDRIEHSLPLGLPLRLRTRSFDGKPFLQQIRCPVLVVSTAGASQFLQSQADLLADRIPTAWHVTLRSGVAAEQSSELATLVEQFQEVPARCPQKARRSIAAAS